MSVRLTDSEEREVANHNKGVKILIFGIIGIVLACTGATFFGVVGMIAVVVGFVMMMANRTREAIVFKKQEQKQMAELMVRQAAAGGKIDVNKITSKPTNSGTKEIIKGAVVGGIIAGEAGAVVGAAIAKDKLENQKK